MQTRDRVIEILNQIGDLDLHDGPDRLTHVNKSVFGKIRGCRSWPQDLKLEVWVSDPPERFLCFEASTGLFTGPEVDVLRDKFEARRALKSRDRSLQSITEWWESGNLNRVTFRAELVSREGLLTTSDIHAHLHGLLADYNAFTAEFAQWQETDPEFIEDDDEEILTNVEDESPVTTNTKPRDIYSDISLGAIHRSDPRKGAAEVIAVLDKLIGLQPVKDLARKLAAQQEIAAKRKSLGLKPVFPSPHLVFTGNPGTGKTTVARHIGQLYKSLGLLDKGHVIEADRSTLVSGYLGQTAIKTKAVCKMALGGVLFIDEAYSLNSGTSSNYGAEAVEALLTFMEEHRGEFAVVVAGYPNKMHEFMEMNPGLRSRFDITVDFPDYSTLELVHMLRTLALQNDYLIDRIALNAIHKVIAGWSRGEGFGNGREVRTLFNQIVANHALSVSQLTSCNRYHLTRIRRDSVPAVVRPTQERKKVENLVPGYL